MTTAGRLDLAGYRLTFDDEFNAFSSNGPSNPLTSTHAGTWDTTLSYGERRLNDEIQFYSDPTIGIGPAAAANGVLTIHAAPSADPSKTWGLPYTSGIITTFHSFSQQYGYFEMRAKLPQGAGMWPAFWMLPLQHVWPPELDPLESFGGISPDGVGGAYSFRSGAVTADAAGAASWHGTGGANLLTQYNTFGVLWRPDVVTFTLNGTAYASMPTPADLHQPMYLLANLAVGGKTPGSPHGEAADLQIDYIRAYSDDAGGPAVVQDSISSPDGGGFDFYGALDANGNGATGGADPPGTTIPPNGAGPNKLVLSLSEDAYQGDADFIVTIDGVQAGGILSTQAQHGAGPAETFTIAGAFGTTMHEVGITFLNDSYAGPGADRNLYLESAAIDGSAIANSTLKLFSAGEKAFRFTAPDPGAPRILGWAAPVAIGSGNDTLDLSVSEDAWQGDAQFIVRVNGTQIGGPQTAAASHGQGQSQHVSVHGNFGSGPNAVSVAFVNDAWGGSAQSDRNLYIDSITSNGTASPGSRAALRVNGTRTFDIAAAAADDTIVVHLSEDMYRGDAQFIASVDGKGMGAPDTVTALHALGQTQDYTFKGQFGAGQHDLAVTFLNDAWAGPSADRNLHVDGVTVNGAAVPAAASLYSAGTHHFQIVIPPP